MNATTREAKIDKSPRFVPEEDPNRVVRWTDINAYETLLLYYRQRLGPATRAIPAMTLPRETFIRLLRGPGALIADIWEHCHGIREQWSFMFVPRKDNPVLISLNIEVEDVGVQVLEYVQSAARSPEHHEFLVQFRILSEQCRNLHKAWLRDRAFLLPLGYHSICNRPSEDGISGVEHN